MIPFQLNMKSGPTPGKIIQLVKPEISLGRDLGNEIVISDADVSRKHARLVMQGEGYLLEDLGSTNGTFVNGVRLSAPQALQSGDLVKLGETIELVYEQPGFDGQATVLAGQAGAFSPTVPAAAEEPAPVVEAYDSSAYASPEPAAAATPTAYMDEAEAAQLQFQPAVPVESAPKSKKTGLYIGIGCAVLLCLCVVVSLVGYFWIYPAVTN